MRATDPLVSRRTLHAQRIVKQTNVIILSIMKGRINETKTKDKLTSSHATAEKLNDSEEEDCGDEIEE